MASGEQGHYSTILHDTLLYTLLLQLPLNNLQKPAEAISNQAVGLKAAMHPGHLGVVGDHVAATWQCCHVLPPHAQFSFLLPFCLHIGHLTPQPSPSTLNLNSTFNQYLFALMDVRHSSPMRENERIGTEQSG